MVFSQYISRKAALLVAVESLLIALGLLGGLKLRFWNDPYAFQFYTTLPDFAFQALTVVLCFQICFYYNELYDLQSIWGPREQLLRLAQALGAACLLLGVLYLVFPRLLIGRGVLFIALILIVASVMLTRVLIDIAWSRTVGKEKVLILGTGRLALDISREIVGREDLNLDLVGFVEENPLTNHVGDRVFGRSVLGHISRLESILKETPVSRIIVAMEDQRGSLPVRELLRLRTTGVQIEDVHSTTAALTGRISLESIRPSWFIFSGGFRRGRLTIVLKRSIDLSFSLVGLVLSLPVMALVAIIVWLDSRGPILYRQARVGLNGACFELLKFRTMQVDAELDNGAQWAEENDPRVTRLGRYLRKYRFDELPQFINVIRGEMSFAGPRPERPEFVELLRQKIPYYSERHTVRPGITGWAQVRYPYGATVEDAFRKLEYDLFYLKNMSILFDFVIVFQTVKIILFGRGAR